MKQFNEISMGNNKNSTEISQTKQLYGDIEYPNGYRIPAKGTD